jgi:hypothetical protein
MNFADLLCTGELTDGENVSPIYDKLLLKHVTLDMYHLPKIFCADSDKALGTKGQPFFFFGSTVFQTQGFLCTNPTQTMHNSCDSQNWPDSWLTMKKKWHQ